MNSTREIPNGNIGSDIRQPQILDIPLTEIDDFPGHPFKVKMDADMAQLMESIREQGIVTPVTLLRKEDGRYEMISGHRRKKACELLGMDTIRANVQELTRDEAILAMVGWGLKSAPMRFWQRKSVKAGIRSSAMSA